MVNRILMMAVVSICILFVVACKEDLERKEIRALSEELQKTEGLTSYTLIAANCAAGENVVIAYAGTEKGVYRKLKGKEGWEAICVGLPLENRAVHSMHLSADCVLCVKIDGVVFQKSNTSKKWKKTKSEDITVCSSS